MSLLHSTPSPATPERPLDEAAVTAPVAGPGTDNSLRLDTLGPVAQLDETPLLALAAATPSPAPQRRGPTRLEPDEDALSGAMLVSNNPEMIYGPGSLADSGKAVTDALAVYVHHSNHTDRALDFYLVFRPTGGKEFQASVRGAANTGVVGSDRTADPNYRTADEYEAQRENAKLKADVDTRVGGAAPQSVKIASLAPHQMLDGRLDVALGGAPCEVEVVCRHGAEAVSGPATGNVKIDDPLTQGRAAGLYEGAMFRDEASIDVDALPAIYPLISGKFAEDGAPAPEAITQKRASVPSAEEIQAVLKKAKSVDAATVTLLERIWAVDPAWLRSAGVWNGTAIDTGAKLIAGDPSYQSLIVGLRDAVAEDMATQERKGTATRTFAEGHATIGAVADRGNYGTFYDVRLSLTNRGKTDAPVSVNFHNAVDNAFRGEVSFNGRDVGVFRDSRNGKIGAVTLGSVNVPAGRSAEAHVRFLGPGQTAAGQYLELKKG